MALAHLPAELIGHIASFLMADHQDVVDFAHTSKTMYRAASHLLLQNKHFWTKAIRWAIRNRDRNKVQSFLRTKTPFTMLRLSFAARLAHAAFMDDTDLDVLNDLLSEPKVITDLLRIGEFKGHPLHHACRYGCIHAVERLLQVPGINLDLLCGSPPQHCLNEAARNRRYPKITSALLKAGAEWKEEDGLYDSPFLTAIKWGNPEAARIHIDAGTFTDFSNAVWDSILKDICHDLEQLNLEMSTIESLFDLIPLPRLFRVSVSTGRADIAKCILETQGDKISEEMPTIMSLVDYESHSSPALTMVRLLATTGGAPFHLQSHQRLSTPAHQAAAAGDKKLLEYVYDMPIDGKPPYEHYNSLLAVSETPNIMQFLLDQGCDVHAQDENGYPALLQMISSWSFQLQKVPVLVRMLKMLLNNGADPNFTAANGSTALALCFIGDGDYGRPLEVVELLFEYGVTIKEPETKSELDWYPMNFVPSKEFSDGVAAVELLLQNGAKVDVKDTNGRTPLMHAIQWKNHPIIELLLAKGASLAERDHQQNSILTIACETNTDSPNSISWRIYDTLQILQDRGLDIGWIELGDTVTREMTNDIRKASRRDVNMDPMDAAISDDQ